MIHTGVSHAVLFVDDVAQVDVDTEGKKWCHSSLFAPSGTNVNFVSLNSEGSIDVRTYEKGVEAETAACGTGSVASALIANKLYGISSPVEVCVHSQKKLCVCFRSDWSQLTLHGAANRLPKLDTSTFQETMAGIL